MDDRVTDVTSWDTYEELPPDMPFFYEDDDMLVLPMSTFMPSYDSDPDDDREPEAITSGGTVA